MKQIMREFLIMNKLQNELKKFDFRVVYQNQGKLADKLGNPKDKLDDLQKSGVYLIGCKDCDLDYVGKTERKLKIRFEEHVRDCKAPGDQKKKPLAFHAITEGHSFNQIKLLKEVRNPRQIFAYESIYLNKHRDKGTINKQKLGNCKSCLLKFSDSLEKT